MMVGGWGSWWEGVMLLNVRHYKTDMFGKTRFWNTL